MSKKNNDNDECVNEKKKRRPHKSSLYKEQKEDVLMKLLDILGIDGDNGFLYLDDISDDSQIEIFDLIDDVKRYFNYCTWSFFKNTDDNKKVLPLIKSILKDMGYDVSSHVAYLTKNGVRTKKTKICVAKK